MAKPPRTVIIHGKRLSDVSPRAAYPGAELWVLTHSVPRYWTGALTDWTRLIDVHPFTPTAWHPGLPARFGHWSWLTQQDGSRRIQLQHADARVPGSETFPREAIKRYFQDRTSTAWQRFTTTADWAMAQAAMEGVDHVVLNGIGVNGEERYQYEHRGILFWLGFLEGRGVRLTIEAPSCYLPQGLDYGYECGAPPATSWPARNLVRRNKPRRRAGR